MNLDIACPVCGRFAEQECNAEVECPFCEYEFALDADGFLLDRCDIEGECELEVNSEGTVIPFQDDADVPLLSEPFPPWHAEVSRDRIANSVRDWRHPSLPDWDRLEIEVYEPPPPDLQLSLGRCPSCGASFRDVWVQGRWCPDCGMAFQLAPVEPLEYDDYDEERDASGEFADPFDTRAPALIVSPWGDGHCTTINEALSAAYPSQRILLRAGLYEESLEVYSAQALVGDAPLDRVVIAGEVRVISQGAVLSGLSIRGKTILERGTLEGCDLSSASGSCLELQGGLVRRTRIHDGAGVGVAAVGGVLEDCTIDRHAQSAVVVGTDGGVFVRRCRIENSGAQGVLIGSTATAQLIECQIHGQTGPGVEVQGVRTLIFGCRVHQQAGHGILIGPGGVAWIERTEVTQNLKNGVEVARGGNLYLERSHIHRGHARGVRIRAGGVAELNRCRIDSHRLANLAVAKGAEPVLRKNRIRRGNWLDPLGG